MKRLARGLLVAVAALALSEAGLRAAFGPPPPPVHVSVGQSGNARYLEARDGRLTTPYQPDARTPAFWPRASGPRVIFLGASSVMGGDVGADARFSTLVSRLLPPVEAVNLAAPAMDSHDLARLAAELDDVDATAVVLYEGHNDYGNAYFQERYHGASGLARARALQALERLQLFARLRLLLAPAASQRVAAPHALTEAERETIAAHFAENLRRVHWRLARRGVPLVLVTPASSVFWPPVTEGCLPAEAALPDAALPADAAPGHETCPRELWERGMALRATDPAAAKVLLEAARDLDAASVRAPRHAAEAVRAVAAELGTPLVDAERALPRDAALDVPAADLFRDQLHLSPAGHAAMAALVTAELRGLVPGPAAARR